MKHSAAAAGKDISTFVLEAIEEKLAAERAEETLAPVRQAFRESGMSKEQLIDFLEEAKHRRRAARGAAGG